MGSEDGKGPAQGDGSGSESDPGDASAQAVVETRPVVGRRLEKVPALQGPGPESGKGKQSGKE